MGHCVALPVWERRDLQSWDERPKRYKGALRAQHFGRFQRYRYEPRYVPRCI